MAVSTGKNGAWEPKRIRVRRSTDGGSQFRRLDVETSASEQRNGRFLHEPGMDLRCAVCRHYTAATRTCKCLPGPVVLAAVIFAGIAPCGSSSLDRKSTRLNPSHIPLS